MKNLLFLFGVLFLSITSLSAQLKPGVTTAGGNCIGEAYLIDDIVSLKKHGFLVIQSIALEEHNLIELQIFNLKRTLTNIQSIKLGHDKGNLRIQGFTEFNNNFLLFLSLYQENTRKNELYLYEFSLPDLKLEKKVKIEETYRPSNLNIPFFYALSPDRSKLLLSSWSYAIPKDFAQLSNKVFNKDLLVVKEQSYAFPYENKELYIGKNLIDNAGNAYIIGKNHTGTLVNNYNQLAQLRGNQFILAFFEDKKDPNLYEIDIKKHNFPLLKFKIDSQQDLVGIGFYKKGAKRNFSGTSVFKLNSSNKELKMNNTEIDKAAFSEALGEIHPNFNTSTSAFYQASIVEVVAKKKAYFLVGERIKLDVESQRPVNYFGGYGFNQNYFRNQDFQYSVDHSLLDMFVIKMDLKGNILWMKRIPKQQVLDEENAPYFSFSVIERERDLLLFYNDHPNNFKIQHKQKLKNTDIRSAVPMLAKVSCNSGKVRKRKLSTLFGKNTLIRPYFCKKLDGTKVFMYGQNKKRKLETYRMKIANLGGS